MLKRWWEDCKELWQEDKTDFLLRCGFVLIIKVLVIWMVKLYFFV